jgi:putative ribosome biogenesis GTPase RsgA
MIHFLKGTYGGTEPMSTDNKAKKSKATKTRKDQGAERIKTSVLLSRSVDIKIRALSGIRGVDKSTLINSLLEEATRGVVVSLRGPLAEGYGAGEGETNEG